MAGIVLKERKEQKVLKDPVVRARDHGEGSAGKASKICQARGVSGEFQSLRQEGAWFFANTEENPYWLGEQKSLGANFEKSLEAGRSQTMQGGKQLWSLNR